MTDAASTFPAYRSDTRGVPGPRLLAWLIDLGLVAALMALLHVALAILGVLTLGLGSLLLVALPAVPFLYAALFLAGPQAATPGQQLTGLTSVQAATGGRPTAVEAVVSIAVFTLSLGFPPLLLVALVTPGHRMLHDLAAGLVMVRTRPSRLCSVGWTMGRRAEGSHLAGSNA